MGSRIFLTALLAGCTFSLSAEEYMVIFKDSKVFDTPNAKGYVTKNQNDEDVSVSSGMVFKLLEKHNGWDIIEYSPGLRAYILDTMSAPASALKTPTAGTYTLANEPEVSASISCAGTEWTLSIDGHNFSGELHGKAVVFYDSAGKEAYSLVVLSGVPLVYTYSNDITKFF